VDLGDRGRHRIVQTTPSGEFRMEGVEAGSWELVVVMLNGRLPLGVLRSRIHVVDGQVADVGMLSWTGAAPGSLTGLVTVGGQIPSGGTVFLMRRGEREQVAATEVTETGSWSIGAVLPGSYEIRMSWLGATHVIEVDCSVLSGARVSIVRRL
jgi:hypothetical protein